MHTYKVGFDYSKDGVHWMTTSKTVNASSRDGAYQQISDMYPYVRNFKVFYEK